MLFSIFNTIFISRNSDNFIFFLECFLGKREQSLRKQSINKQNIKKQFLKKSIITILFDVFLKSLKSNISLLFKTSVMKKERELELIENIV